MSECVNEYNGYNLNSNTIDHIDFNNVKDAAVFFEEYVAKRKPCVIKGICPDFKGYKKWTWEYLKSKAGKSNVDVEIATKQRTFGTGTKKQMKFESFIDAIDSGDTSLYLTTQEIKLNPITSRPYITSSPVTNLVRETKDVPIVPAIFGNLIPMNLNIWIGNSKDGSSTGLHHDYHDNLYMLLRGRKRFRLYSPGDAPYLYTYGCIEKIHSNGRINYKGFPTNADGSEVGALKSQQAHESRLKAETELEEAEAAVKRGEKGASERLAKAEAALENAMDQLLDAGDDFDDFDEISDVEPEEDDEHQEKKRKIEEEDPCEVPINFSKINLNSEADTSSSSFPLFSKAKQAECFVNAGEMLFLPAGWFHEVTSYSVNDEQGHMAFNYWMHPPDNMTSFSSPYASTFWKNDWEAREEKI